MELSTGWFPADLPVRNIDIRKISHSKVGHWSFQRMVEAGFDVSPLPLAGEG
jgi:hypothetical protein